MLIITACGSKSSNAASGPATIDTKGQVYDTAFGEKFHYYRTNSITNLTSKLAITLSSPEVVDFRDETEEINETDYVKVFIQVENVGDGNGADAVSQSNFTVYDANGKEISTLKIHVNKMEGEFIGTELRPGGKNEGYLYLPIQEDSVPAEIIFFDSLIRGAHTNQFVIKM